MMSTRAGRVQRLLTTTALAALLCAATPAADAATPPTNDFHIQTLWRSGTDGVCTYRLPAITRAASGVLLAFAERRSDCGDGSVMDLVMKRSFDDGRTWEQTDRVVLDDAPGAARVNNPTVVAHSDGPVFLFSTTGPGPGDNRPRVPRVQISYDDGDTWTPPRDISAAIKPPSGDNDWFTTGPGHGIELTRGPHQGRLVVPVTYKVDDDREQGVRMTYSDDLGQTWHIGASVKYDLDDFQLVEPTIAQDDDGDLLMIARNGAVKDQHTSLRGLVQAVSEDGGETFKHIASTDLDGDGFLDDDARYGHDNGEADDDPTATPVFTHTDVLAPPIHASLLRYRYDDSGYSRLLLSAPARPKTDNNARGMFVRSSFDDGTTWRNWSLGTEPRGVEIDSDHAGYSDLVRTSRGIGVLYEAGEIRFRDEIRFNFFTESALGLPDE